MAIPIAIYGPIIAAIPALLVPLLSPLMQRLGFARQEKEIGVFQKRLQIIEQLLTLEKHLSDETRNLLTNELADIAHDLVADRGRERSAVKTVLHRLSIFERFLLIYPQPTMRAFIYRGMFWFLLSLGVLFIISVFIDPIINAFVYEGALYFDPSKIFPFASIGAFYVAIGLLFRGLALRQLKRSQAARLLRSDPSSFQRTRVSPLTQSKTEQQSG